MTAFLEWYNANSFIGRNIKLDDVVHIHDSILLPKLDESGEISGKFYTYRKRYINLQGSCKCTNYLNRVMKHKHCFLLQLNK